MVRVRHNRDLERDRVGKFVENVWIKRDADDQDAVNQRSEKQHRGQPVRLFWRDKLDVFGVVFDRGGGHDCRE